MQGGRAVIPLAALAVVLALVVSLVLPGLPGPGPELRPDSAADAPDESALASLRQPPPPDPLNVPRLPEPVSVPALEPVPFVPPVAAPFVDAEMAVRGVDVERSRAPAPRLGEADERARATGHGGPHINGTVTAAGAGVAGVQVTAFFGGTGSFCCSSAATAVTSGTGTYTLALPGPGSYRVLFVPPGTSTLVAKWWATGTASGASFGNATDVNVPLPTSVVTGISPVLAAGFAITGAITLSPTASPNATVSAFVGGVDATCCDLVARTQTSATGQYTLRVANGIYRVRFEPPSASNYVPEWFNDVFTFSSATDVPVSNANTTADAILVLGFHISGTVTDPNGNPVPDVVALALECGANALLCTFVLDASTDSAGIYSFLVPPGTYRLLFVPPPSTNLVAEWFNNASTISAATDIPVTNADVPGKNVQLVAGFRISGTVTDGTNPIANVIVQPALGGANATCCTFVHGARTNSSGQFGVLVAPGTYRVRFSPSPTSNFIPEWFDDKPRFELATDIPVTTADVPGRNAVLATGFRIQGTVTDGTNPIANVSVQAYVGGPNATCCTFVNNASPNSSGQFGVLVAPGTYRLRFSPSPTSNFLPEWWDNVSRFDLATDVPVTTADVPGKNAVLASGFAISGTVTSAGAGVQGVSVNAYLGGTGALCCTWITGTNTNASGQYTLLVTPGTYRLQFFVRTGNLLSEWWDDVARFDLAADIPVTDQNVTGKNAALASGFRISGTVRDSAGAVLQDISVSAYLGGTGATCCTWVTGTATNAAGVYELVVTPGTYRVHFYPRFGTHIAEWFDDKSRFDLAADIPVTADVPGKDAVLGTGFRISGTVTDATGPLEGIDVNAFVGGVGALCCTWITGRPTNAQGQYSLLVPAGTYRLLFYPRAGTHIQEWFDDVRRFDLAADILVTGDVSNVDAALVAGFKISGTVTDASGAVQGISVNAFAGGPGGTCCAWVSGTVTRTTGEYDLRVPAGTYRLLFYPFQTNHVPEWWDNVSRFDLATDITVSLATGNVTGKNAQLGTGVKVSGTVTGANGLPLEGVIAAVFEGGANALCCTFVASGRPTDANGQYSLFVPGGATYRLLFWPTTGNHVLEWWNDKEHFQVATDIAVGNADITANAQLRAGFKITGTVTNAATGAPIERVAVHAFVGGSGAICCSFVATGRPTNAAGQYELVLPNGTYRIRFFPIEGGSFIPEWWDNTSRFDLATDIVVNNADVPGSKDAQLATGFQIKGIVTAVGGGALSGISVSAYIGGSGATCCNWVSADFTNTAGEYEIVVPNGTYRIRFYDFAGNRVSEWWDDVPRFDLAADIVVNNADVTGRNAALAFGFKIEGTLTDTAGAPLPGISANAYVGGSGATCCTWIAGALTNANGRYALVVPVGTYRIWFYPRTGTHVAKWWTSAGTFDTATDIVVSADVSNIDAQLAPSP